MDLAPPSCGSISGLVVRVQATGRTLVLAQAVPHAVGLPAISESYHLPQHGRAPEGLIAAGAS